MEAETLCDLHGGSLLVIDSPEDFAFIKNTFPESLRYWTALKAVYKTTFKSCGGKFFASGTAMSITVLDKV